MRIALTSVPAHGHINPTLPMVRELTQRGHSVLYATNERMRETVEAAGAELVPLPGEMPTNPRELTPGGNRGNLLPRRPRRQARIDLGRTLGDFHVGGSLYAASRRYDDLGNARRMSGYALADLRVAWRISPAWHLRLSLNNVLDRRYESAMYYNQAGRNYLLSLSYRPAR